MLKRTQFQAISTWLALLGLGHVYNVWIGVLGALVVNLIYAAIKED